MADVRHNTAEVRDELGKIRAEMKISSRAVIEEALDIVERDIEDRIDQGIDMNGKPFAPLSDAYAKQKRRKFPGMPILKATRRMLAGINIKRKFTGNQTGTTTGSLEYTAEHAEYHQQGGKNLPKREFIGVSATADRAIDEMMSDWLDDVLTRAKTSLRPKGSRR